MQLVLLRLCALCVAVAAAALAQLRVTPKLFDHTLCSNASHLPLVTAFASCPCFLQYHITSASANSTWDVMLLNSSSYLAWQRANFSGVPPHRAQYSLLNASAHALEPVQLPPTNVFDNGLYALVIRASTNRTQCFGAPAPPQLGTELVFESMPTPCPLVSAERNNNRIVGGSAVNAANSGGSFGWMALIWELRNGQARPVCGGSQFRVGFIATAAHCLVHEAPQRYRVSLGVARVDAQRARLLRIGAARAHPQYRTLASNEALYDVAVLQLLDAGNKHTIALNIDARTPATGEFVTAAGFGYISEMWPALPVPNRLLRVDVPVVSSARCARTFGGVRADVHVCAGYETGGCDSCQADSGGPLRYVRRDGREVLVGVVSFGWGCARPHSAGVYTRVSAVAPWMRRVAEQAATAAAERRRARAVALGAGGGVGALLAALLGAALVARWWRRRATRRDAARSSRSQIALSESGVSQ